MVHIYLCLARALSAHLGRFLFPSLSSPLTTVPAPGEDTEELPLWLNLTPKIWGWLPQGTGLGFLFYLHCQTQQNCTRANASNTELLEHRHISVSAHKCTGLPSPPQDSKGAVLGGDPTALPVGWRGSAMAHMGLRNPTPPGWAQWQSPNGFPPSPLP